MKLKIPRRLRLQTEFGFVVKNKTVYVCFVHNNFDDLCGEDDISCLMVTDDQKEIDKWLEKQFAEAKENGYFSDEDVSSFKGKSEFTVTISKGNEKDGYDSYYFFCRPAMLKKGI